MADDPIFALYLSSVPNHAEIKDELVSWVKSKIPPDPEFRSAEQEAEYRDRYSAQHKTTEDLFKSDQSVVKALNRRILAFAQNVVQSECWFETQFGLIKKCDRRNRDFAEMWHCHEYDFSVVYYLQIPSELPFPQSYFTYLAPDQQFIKPSEGMLIGVFQNVIHDGIKPWDGNYERIVLVSEFNIRKQDWHHRHALDESQIDCDDAQLREFYDPSAR